MLEIARGIRRSVGPPTACRPGVLLTPSHPILNLHTRPRAHIPYSEPLPYTALPLCVNVMRPHAYHSARRLTFPRPSMWKVHIIRSVCCCPFRSSLGEPNRMPLPVSMLIQVSSSPSTGSSAASDSCDSLGDFFQELPGQTCSVQTSKPDTSEFSVQKLGAHACQCKERRHPLTL